MLAWKPQQCEWIGFLALSLIVAALASSSTTSFDKPSPDGLQITTTVASTSSEGFKPSSYEFVRSFSPDHFNHGAKLTERNDTITLPVPNTTEDPHNARKPDEFKLDILKTEPPVIIELFKGSHKLENKNPSAISVINSPNTGVIFPEKSSRLYYDDIPLRKRGQGLGYPSPIINEVRVGEPRPPYPHDSAYKFYFADKYSTASKNSREPREPIAQGQDYTHYGVLQDDNVHSHQHDQSHIRNHGHGHNHQSDNNHNDNGGHGHDQGSSGGYGHAPVGHAHDHDHGRGVISGHGEDLGYSAGPISAHYKYPPSHYSAPAHGHSSSSSSSSSGSKGEFAGYVGGRDAIGKALSILLPSALLLTGVSALFPKRVQVPTQQIRDPNRQKRSVDEHELSQHELDVNYEVVPSQLLRREHRSDGEEAVLYDYDDGTLNNPYTFSSENPSSVILNENENHRTHHSPTLVVEQVPEFIRIPNDEFNPVVLATHLPHQTQFLYGEHGYPNGQYSHDNYDFKTKYLQNPTPEEFEDDEPDVTSSPEIMNPIPKSLPKPTASTRSLNQPTYSTNSVSSVPKIKTVFKRVKPARPEISYLENINAHNIETPDTVIIKQINQIVAESKTNLDNIKGSASFIQAQKVSKKNTKDNTAGKGAAKALQDFLMTTEMTPVKEYDLSPNGPVLGLLTAAVEHGGQSDPCQRRSLCELAMRGTNPTATKFETFLWSLATLVPDAFTTLYDVDDVFTAIRTKTCEKFKCTNPDLNIQE